MSSTKSYNNKIMPSVPYVTVKELSSTDSTTSCGTLLFPSHSFAPRLSPQHTGDNNDVGVGLSLTTTKDSVAASTKSLSHVLNRDYEVGAAGEIKAVGSDMPLLAIEVELIEAERARDRAFTNTLSEAEASGAEPYSDYSVGVNPDHRGAHGFRCAWHSLSLAVTNTFSASVPDECECREPNSNEISGQAASTTSTTSQIPSHPPAARMGTNDINSSLGGFSVTQHVPDLCSFSIYESSLDWSPKSMGGVPPYHHNKRYHDGPFSSHIYRSLRLEDSAVQEVNARELEKQHQAIAFTERDSLESVRSFEPSSVSILSTAMPGRVLTPSVVSIHSISPPASVYNGIPKNTFAVDNSAVGEHQRDARVTAGATGHDSFAANLARGSSCERRDSLTHHSLSSLSHFTHLTVDTSSKTKIVCLVIICIFLALSGTVLWLMSKRRMHIAPGVFTLFVLGVATLKLGSECLRAFGLRRREVTDLERCVGVGQKNVASLI